ncbi:MAG TPA: ATP-binding protein [Gemmatimonadales bacterium]|nr:ATP-binding protein [Gemmatimonadales bacterium]
MTPPAVRADQDRRGLWIAVGALASYTVMSAAYLLNPASQKSLAPVAWTWASLYATIAALVARRQADESVERRALGWIATGCAIWLGGQLGDDWSYLKDAPQSLAKGIAALGYVGIYPCLVAAVAILLRPQLRRVSGMAVILDTLLLTFTSGILTFELLSEQGPVTDFRRALLGIVGGLGAFVLLWSILVGVLNRTRTLQEHGSRAFGALVVFALGSVAYAAAQIVTGQIGSQRLPLWVVTLGWTALFYILAAGIAWKTPLWRSRAFTDAKTGVLSHLVVLIAGLGGVFGVAVIGILRPGVDVSAAILVGAGGIIIAARLVLALRTDQEYARRLEQDVERQTRSLSESYAEQRRIEAQLQQSDKLAALGQLVSGVAHEINNPAAIISGFAQTMLLDELPAEQREMAEMVRDEAMRIGRITSNLLAFARSGGSERDLIDVNDVVRRTYALRSYHLNTLNIAVAVDLSPETPVVWGNGPQLQQMLLNLLINAEQALAAQQGNRSIAVRTVAASDTVRIEVADTGPGVPGEIQTQIFDPFFTTKPVGVGTGLGLSICYGIVQEHGGRIVVDSRPGQGATFVVQLPRDTRPLPKATPEPATRAAVDPAGLRVLLVDDEPALREAARRFLERSGIATDVAADGQAALEALGTRAYDVIISDVRMPGMDGRDFIARLRKDRPELLHRLILSTGDTFAEDTAGLVAETGVPTLVKPFDFDTLERIVRKTAGAH